MRHKLLLLYANTILISCRLWYWKRYDVSFGRINNGVEIYRCKRGSLSHKFRVSYRLKFIKGV